MIAASRPALVALETVGAALVLSSVVFLAVLVVHRLLLRRALRRRAAHEDALRPLAFEVLDGELNGLPPLRGLEAEVLAELLGRYARRLRGDARAAAAAWFEQTGAVEAQLGALRSWRAWRRATAAFLLGDMDADRAVPRLVEALADRDGEVRAAAARSLGRLGANEAVEPLLAAVAAGRLPRLVAGQALLELGPAAVPALLPLVHAEEPLARAEAVELLGLLAVGVDARTVLVALRDPGAIVREQAARALGRLGADEAAAGLREALADRIPAVRAAAAEALGAIGDRDAVPALLDVARTDVDGPARAAAHAVARIDEEALAGERAPYLLEAKSLAEL